MSVKVKVESVSKLFNDERGEGLKRLAQGQSKERIFRETGVTVGINEVSFDVNEGEIFVIMGLSGSGKSTLVRTLNGLIPPTSGKILIDGTDVASCDKKTLRNVRREKISMVFQHFALFPHKTVADNVAFGLKVKGVDKDRRRDEAMKALEKVGLDAHADTLPGSLSGGMQQRVGLARGLANDPQILLMDEPFGALDPLIRREMQDELLVLQKELKKTIVFITHDLNEALLLGDRIAIMKDGAFVQVGTAQDIVSEPADDYVRAFVADIDRSRVYTASDIALDAHRVPLTGTVADARKAMEAADTEILHVVKDGVPAGLLTLADIKDVKPQERVMNVMHAHPPTVPQDAYLNEIYSEAQAGMPLAVTDDDGKLVGVVEPGSIFTHLANEEEATEDAAETSTSEDTQETKAKTQAAEPA